MMFPGALVELLLRFCGGAPASGGGLASGQTFPLPKLTVRAEW